MSFTPTSGSGGTRPVKIELQAQQNIAPELGKIEQKAQETSLKLQQAFTAASRAIDATERETVEAARNSSAALQKWGEEVQRIRGRYEAFQQDARKAQGGFSRDLTNALQGAQQSLGQLSHGIQEFAQRSSALSTVGMAFRKMAADAGVSSDELLKQLKSASKGTIDELELMRQANMGLLLMGKDLAKQMPELFAVATASAKATGQDINYLTQSVMIGIGRESKLILDNLGVVVKLEEVHKRYAESLGKTAEQLTQVERKQALANEVIGQLRERLGNADPALVSFGDQVKAANAELQNLKDRVTQAASSIPGLASAFAALGAASGAASDLSGVLLGVNALLQIGGVAAVGWGAAIVGAAALAAAGVAKVSKALEEDEAAFNKHAQGVEKQIAIFDDRFRALEEHRDRLRLLASGRGLFDEAFITPSGALGDIKARGDDVFEAAEKFHTANARLAEDFAAAKHFLGEHLLMLKEQGAGYEELNSTILKFGQDFRQFKFSDAELFGFGGEALTDALKRREEAQEKAQRDEKKARDKHLKEMDRKEKRALREMEKDRREFASDTSKALQLARADELEDLKERSAALEAGVKWFFETQYWAEKAGETIVDWSKSSRDAIAEYRAAVEAAVAAEAGGAGLSSLQFSRFGLSSFGAEARAKDVVRAELGPAPKPEGTFRGFVPDQPDFIGHFGRTGIPFEVQAAIYEYEILQQRIGELDQAMDRQPQRVEALRKAFREHNLTLRDSTDLLSLANEELVRQAKGVDEAIGPMANAREEFGLAGAAVQDTSRSLSRLHLSSRDSAASLGQLTGYFETLGQQGGTLQAFTSEINVAREDLQSFAAAAEEERTGRLRDFRDYFSATPGGLTAALGVTTQGLGGAEAAAVQFASGIGNLLGGAAFVGLKHYFETAIPTATGNTKDALMGPPGSVLEYVKSLDAALKDVKLKAGFADLKAYFDTVVPGAVGGAGGAIVISMPARLAEFGTIMAANPIHLRPGFFQVTNWFLSTLPAAVASTRTEFADVDKGLPHAIGIAEQKLTGFHGHAAFVAETGLAAKFDAIGQKAGTMKTAFEGLLDVAGPPVTEGPLTRVAAQFKELDTAAAGVKGAIEAMGVSGSSGIMGKMAAEMTTLATGGHVGSLKTMFNDLKNNFFVPWSTESNAWSFPGLAKEIGKTGAALGPDTVTTSLAARFKDLFKQVAGQPEGTFTGPLVTAASMFSQWDTAVKSLGGAEGTFGSIRSLSAALSSLKNELNSMVSTRNLASTSMQFPGQQAFPPWSELGVMMHPARVPTSEVTWPKRWFSAGNAAAALQEYWQSHVGFRSAGGLSELGSFGMGFGRAPAAEAPAGGGVTLQINLGPGSIVIQNPQMTDERSLDQLADRLSSRLGQKLVPLVQQLVGGRR